MNRSQSHHHTTLTFKKISVRCRVLSTEVPISQCKYTENFLKPPPSLLSFFTFFIAILTHSVFKDDSRVNPRFAHSASKVTNTLSTRAPYTSTISKRKPCQQTNSPTEDNKF